MPPSENPTTAALVWSNRRSATALDSCSGGTVMRVIACDDGPLSAERQPLTAPTPASSGIVDQPPISDAAITAWVTALPAAEPCIISWRGTRSPRTPPKRTVTTSASANVATTSPSCEAEPPRSSTANASATGVIALPRELAVVPVTRSRKSRKRSGPRRPAGAEVVVVTRHIQADAGRRAYRVLRERKAGSQEGHRSGGHPRTMNDTPSVPPPSGAPYDPPPPAQHPVFPFGGPPPTPPAGVAARRRSGRTVLAASVVTTSLLVGGAAGVAGAAAWDHWN